MNSSQTPTIANTIPIASSPGAVNGPHIDPLNPQTAILDLFFPGFSVLSNGLFKYANIDLNRYFPMLLGVGGAVVASRYAYGWIWDFIDQHLMSTADIRSDDEMYNMLMAWVTEQKFSKRSRRFVANTNLNTRSWLLWSASYGEDDGNKENEDEDTVDFDVEGNPVALIGGKKDKKVRYTPSFGTHYFWYKGHILLFRRTLAERMYGSQSEREEIAISCFGRNPAILKVLLDECRSDFTKIDESRTVIYRGGMKPGTTEPTWTRCISRVSRPFSTVVLDENVKQSLLDDMRDYLHPSSRRWYSNRGIPYRRGYLLFGPPGTGKTSLSYVIAGYFKLKIYIVSLNSPTMDEENLGNLFADLPTQCVVLLEDIDTAGLTHAREFSSKDSDTASVTTLPGSKPTSTLTSPKSSLGRISLSALLNILDGVASAEGRILIMTTNHIDKLDDALIRPGRVDMMVKFDLASTTMLVTIFLAIYATLEGDLPSKASHPRIRSPKSEKEILDEKLREEEEAAAEREFQAKKKVEDAKVDRLSVEFAKMIPDMTFSPAEVQGYLLKHKREPERAIEGAAEWVRKTKTEKKKQAEREIREEEERVKQEEKKGKEEKIVNGEK